MKKIILLFIILILVSGFALAEYDNNNNHGNNNGVTGSGNIQAIDDDDESVTVTTTNTQITEEDKPIPELISTSKAVRSEIKTSIQLKEKELEEELEEKPKKEKKVLRNQNQVRLAVHALKEIKIREGGIGQQVSAIAKDFDNSVQATIISETKIEKRSRLKRIFVGGDKKAAEEIESRVEANKEKIEQLKTLKETANEEETTIMEAQIQNMEQEQTRLESVVTKEKRSKGIFGWLWK